jgi:hypothetical protein
MPGYQYDFLMMLVVSQISGYLRRKLSSEELRARGSSRNRPSALPVRIGTMIV